MNVYLMTFYDEYDKLNTIKSLEEFTTLTFPQDGTDKLFIGCVLILINSVYRTRVTAEALSTIVQAVKKKVGDSNLLKFYIERINDNKLISKYLFKVINDKKLDIYADMILDYLKKCLLTFVMKLVLDAKTKLKNL